MSHQDQETTHDLHEQEAIDKMRELIKHNNICLFTTRLSETPFQTRPMSIQEVDDDGCLWCFSADDSDKNHQLIEDDRVQLFFANPNQSEFMSVFGRATVVRDRERIAELWTPIVKAWFKEGKDDPHLTLLRVQPIEAYYWDTKNNKMIALVKILASTVTGKTMDDGVEGKLKV